MLPALIIRDHILQSRHYVGVQVRKIWADLMVICPDPATASDADEAAIETLLYPLGFYRFRARAIVSMSADYLNLPWRRPSELRYVGKYASDAYFIFCRCAVRAEAHCWRTRLILASLAYLSCSVCCAYDCTVLTDPRTCSSAV
jgi:hypothetical protein